MTRPSSSILARYPGVLYRCFDADDRLLYIGATYNLERRTKAHAHRSPWWPQVARVTSESFEFRWQAMTAERAAIVNEKPLHNRRTHYRSEPTAVDSSPECLTYSVAQAAQVAGMNETSVRRLIARGEFPAMRFGDRLVVPKVQLHAMLAASCPDEVEVS